MDSASSRELIEKKEEKKQESVFNGNLSIFNHLPVSLQRHTLSFVFGDKVEKFKYTSGFSAPSLAGSFFFEYNESRDSITRTLNAKRVMQDLARRIKVDKTLTFMQENSHILRTLPFSVEITDRCGRKIKRNSIISTLVALDELPITEAKSDAKPDALIPTIFSWFKEGDPIKKQLQEQLAETLDPLHEQATKARRKRSLDEIELFIHKIISSDEITNDSEESFETSMNRQFVQDFIKNAFPSDAKDTGEWGIIWDGWSLYSEYLDLLTSYADKDHVKDKSRLNLGGLYSRKAYVAHTAIFLAILKKSQFRHLEVYACGVGNISATDLPDRFDCSKDAPAILANIGSTHFFGFFGDYNSYPDFFAALWTRVERAACLYKIFVKQKQQHYTAYATLAASDESLLSNNVETRRSPAATAAGR